MASAEHRMRESLVGNLSISFAQTSPPTASQRLGIGFRLVLQGFKYTVEVGSLHTLRLEALKLVFQPLHTFLVNKL